MTKNNDAMRIGFDLRYLQAAYRNSPGGGLGGVGVYIQGLWKALAHLFPETEFVALVDHGDIPERLHELVTLAPKAEIMAFGLAGRGRIIRRLDRSGYSWLIRALESEFHWGIPREVARLDILHVMNQSPAPDGLCHTVMTMYDLCPMGAGVSVKQTWLEKIHRQYLTRLGRADRLVCISESTRNDAVHYFTGCGAKTAVVYPGIDLDIFKPGISSKTEVKEKFGIAADYFIHVGVCSGRKNPRGLIEAMKIAVEDCNKNFMLVFVGPYQVIKNAAQTIRELAGNSGIGGRIMILGDVSDTDLAVLYRNALALVFPSFYEGFGYPAVESLACGTPCIVSNISSLPEAVGDLGLLVDPADASQIASAMVSIVRSGKTERVKIEGPRWAKNFSWDHAAIAYMGIYRGLVCDDEHVN